MLKRVFFLGLVILFFCIKGMAQSEATRVLNTAEDDFEQGKLSGIEAELEQGKGKYFKKGGFSKEELIRAHRLLTLVHLYNDDEPGAEESFINLLKADPEHPPVASDPAEFHFLHEKFNTAPIFRVGFKVGVNSTQNNVLTTFAQNNTSTPLSEKSYAPGIGFNLEATFEYPLPVKNLEAIGGLLYSIQSYTVEYDPLINYFTSVKESQTWFNVPVMLRYNLEFKEGSTFVPFLYGGYLFSYLLAAKIDGTRTGGQSLNISGVDILASDQRNKINQSIIAGVGLKYRMKINYAVVELRYVSGISNVVKSENRFENLQLRDELKHADDNFAQNYLSVSFGYIHSLYKPKKYSEKKFNKNVQKKLKEENE